MVDAPVALQSQGLNARAPPTLKTALKTSCFRSHMIPEDARRADEEGIADSGGEIVWVVKGVR